MDGVDLVLMRSNSGNQILDIDFGSAEAALMGPTRDQLMGPASRVGPSHGHPQMHQQHHQQHSIYGGPGGQFANVRSDPVNNLHGLSHFGAMPHMQPQIAMPSGQPMRKLKIVEHHVHRIDTHTKDNGDPEEELVVSNLRHFTLKVAVVDVNEMPILDTELPLQATLLYENGLPVKQLSNSEPLLVGEPEVVALQGSAVFKLRITSLSSHRDKQRFRIQIAPQSQMTRQHEPALTIVTDPMKSVTKLAHRSVPKEVGLAMPTGMFPPMGIVLKGEGSDNGAFESEVSSTLKQHSEQIGQLQEMHSLILKQLQDLNGLVRGLVTGTADNNRRGGGGGGSSGEDGGDMRRTVEEDE